jgi:hypothetical protein
MLVPLQSGAESAAVTRRLTEKDKRRPIAGLAPEIADNYLNFSSDRL